MIQAIALLMILPGLLVASSHQNPKLALGLGKTIYQKQCKVCHGVQGNAKSFAANALYPPPRNFTSAKSKNELSRQRMIRSVTKGRPGTAMMPWEKNLTAKEIQAVVDYIWHRLMHRALPGEE
jgi:cytochrome c oxidase cbb3-type subunit 3